MGRTRVRYPPPPRNNPHIHNCGDFYLINYFKNMNELIVSIFATLFVFMIWWSLSKLLNKNKDYYE
jgi:hypothetical protein